MTVRMRLRRWARAQGKRRGVHHGEVPGDRFPERKSIKFDRTFVLHRIGGINAVDLRRLHDRLAVGFQRTQCRRGVRREIRRTGPAGKNHEFAA